MSILVLYQVCQLCYLGPKARFASPEQHSLGSGTMQDFHICDIFLQPCGMTGEDFVVKIGRPVCKFVRLFEGFAASRFRYEIPRLDDIL